MSKYFLALVTINGISVLSNDRRENIAHIPLPGNAFETHELNAALQRGGYPVASAWQIVVQSGAMRLEAAVVSRH